MNFNVDKCSVMHIGHNNMQGNYNMFNQWLPTADQKRDLGIILNKVHKWQKETENSCNGSASLSAWSSTYQSNLKTCVLQKKNYKYVH